jgi:hypothetical protein
VPTKGVAARCAVKRLAREQSKLISKNRELRDIHEHKQTKAVKERANKALIKVGKLSKRMEKLGPVARGKLLRTQ